MTATNLLATYNDLVARANELDPTLNAKPIKIWKGKKSDLQAKIDSLADVCASLAPRTSKPKKEKKTTEPRADVVTVAELARRVDQNPKVVRARLRRLYSKGTADLPTPVEGPWTFSRKDETRVLALISPPAVDVPDRASDDADARAEQDFELSAAFGSGVRVVNVLTGKATVTK
jgi:hypothetical protein